MNPSFQDNQHEKNWSMNTVSSSKCWQQSYSQTDSKKSRGQNSSWIQRKRRPACILYCLDLWVESPSFIFLRQVYNFWGMVQNNGNNKSPAAMFDTAVQCPQYQPFHEIHVPCVISIATSHSGNSRYHNFDLPPIHWPTQQKIWWHRCLYATHCPNCMMHWGCMHGQ